MPSTVLETKAAPGNPVTIEVYRSDQKKLWNDFVAKAKNGVFLFERDYMEYHSDRFVDHSLFFYYNGRLVALMPANVDNGAFQSHGGLTFGGVVSAYSMKTHIMLGIFRSLIQHCRNQGINEIIYKPVPYIYHSIPADEDLYALFVNDAKLMARNVSSCIYLPKVRKFDDNRQDNIRKAKNNEIAVKESLDFDLFMKIEQETLSERHGVKPVHSVEEIVYLATKFPNNIKLYASYKAETMLAGIIIYESKNVAHMQYAANSKEGWNLGAQDIIEDYLINNRYKEKPYFDFGISTEKLGQVLNVGLIKRKENFGASAVMYDIYHMTF
jgi:hypothetical protein